MPRVSSCKGADDSQTSSNVVGGVYIIGRCSSGRLVSGIDRKHTQAHQEGHGSAGKLGQFWTLQVRTEETWFAVTQALSKTC